MRSFLACTLFLVTLVHRSSLHQTKSCKDYVLPIKTNSTNLKWNLNIFKSDFDIATYYNEFGRRDRNVTFKPITVGTAPESAVYNLSGTYCEPSSGGSGTVIVATHGGGFDKSYVYNALDHFAPF